MGLFSKFSKPPSRDEFAKMVMEEIQKKGETREIKYDSEKFRLSAEGELLLLIGHVRGLSPLPERTVLALRKFYKEYSSLSRVERTGAFKRYVERWFILPTEPLDELIHLREHYRSASAATKKMLEKNFGKVVDDVLGGEDHPQSPPVHNIDIKIDVPTGFRLEGDSMGLAMLLATISALSEVPMKRGVAVTGAINHYGDVLAVDFVNKKIEGWFRICKQNGLTGEQGVIIPKGNEKDLNLGEEIVEAVRNHQFHVYAVQNVDQAIEIVTDLPAEQVNERVRKALEKDPENK